MWERTENFKKRRVTCGRRMDYLIHGVGITGLCI